MARPPQLSPSDLKRYSQAVDYLERYLWHELPIIPVERALQSRIRRLLDALGDPHRRFPVAHVGGSAGKGSTSVMLAAILQAAGLRTGLYTSPHLQTFIERIAVDGRLVAPADFAETVLGMGPLVRRMHVDVLDGRGHGRPSLVEVAFAVGMAHFARERCEAAVVEVGLGGRTDCTNVFDRPAVTVLTNVELEHRERLGDTVEAIAREKSHIVKGGAVVTGARHAAALRVIEARCAERGARLWRLGREVRLRTRAGDAAGSVIDVRLPGQEYRDLRLPVAGAHQARNAALAVAAAHAFAAATGVPLDHAVVRDGLASVRISCRLEAVQRDPLVLLDGAHNPVEARNLADALQAHWLRPGVRAHLVVGVLADKDQRAMARQFARVAASVIVTQPPLAERRGDPGRMLDVFRRELGARRVRFEPDPAAAMDAAIARARPRDVICAAGSMFLVGALRERWVPERSILRHRTAFPP